jgi:hypothetical protein
MEQTFVVQFDDDPIRFTPEGKVFVVDAIKALTQSEDPERLWDDLKKKKPKIPDHCEDHRFQQGQCLMVVDKEGWEMLWILLIDDLG